MTTTAMIKPASFGSISTATLKSEDLLNAFSDELEWQIRRNGEYFSLPENFAQRDKLNALVGEAQDCLGDNGIETYKKGEADELINETLPDALQLFAPAHSYFGNHPGDGSDFGYWLGDIEEMKNDVGFVSLKTQEYPDTNFRGEWLHINERGNCTLYVRGEDGKDREIWSVV